MEGEPKKRHFFFFFFCLVNSANHKPELCELGTLQDWLTTGEVALIAAVTVWPHTSSVAEEQSTMRGDEKEMS